MTYTLKPCEIHTGTLTTRCHAAMAVVAGLLLAGCTILPNSNTRSLSKWDSYEDAHKAFDTIVEGQSSHKDVQFLGFTPEGSANVKILNYVDVANMFGSAFRPEDLPVGVKTCVTSQAKCKGYVVRVTNIQNRRNGNVAADLLGFRKRTHMTGWEFQATVVLVDNLVVYKLWNGTPTMESYDKQNTPLGPFQNLGGAIPKPW